MSFLDDRPTACVFGLISGNKRTSDLRGKCSFSAFKGCVLSQVADGDLVESATAVF